MRRRFEWKLFGLFMAVPTLLITGLTAGLSACVPVNAAIIKDRQVKANTVLSKHLDLTKDGVFPCIYIAKTSTLMCVTQDELAEMMLKDRQ